MYQPLLYTRVNTLQRQNAKIIMDDFVNDIQLCSDGKDSLMDIGCGTGDVLIDFVYPILPKTFTKVIGTDISQKMIEYSKKKYAKYDKIDFEVLDIQTNKLPSHYRQQFDHVTSFYCLHWVQDQRQAFKNVYNMLLNGGDCLLVFATSSPLYETYANLSKDSRWCKYMTDANKFVPPSQNNPDPWLTYTNLAKEVGFIDQKVKIQDVKHTYEGIGIFSDHLLSVNPFADRMPLSKQEEYINELCNCWKELGLCEKLPVIDDYRYILPVQLAVVYARKK